MHSFLGLSHRDLPQTSSHKSYHDNNIANIIETNGKQIYYQIDKDWFYRPEERRWNVMNDESSWRKNELGKWQDKKYDLSLVVICLESCFY